MNRYNGSSFHSTIDPEIVSVDSSSVVADTRTDVSNMSVDPFLLDFGTSINVTEEMHRELRASTQVINQKIHAEKQKVQVETRLSTQLNRDLTHAVVELSNLTRGASNRLEDATFHANILNDFETTLKADLIPPPPPLSTEGNVLNHVTNINKNIKGDIHANQSSVVKTLHEFITKHSQETREYLQLGKETKQKTSSLALQIQQQDYTSQIETSKQCNDVSSVDLKNEATRKSCLQQKMQKVRSQTGSHAQDLAEKASMIFFFFFLGFYDI